MQISDAIELLAKLKLTGECDEFEALVVLAKSIVRQGLQFDLNGQEPDSD